MKQFSRVKQAFSGCLQWFLKLSLKKKIIVTVLVVLLGIFSFSKVKGAGKNTPQYQTAQVERGDIINTITESGAVSATNVTDVTSPTDGIISEVYVKNGDEVEAGQNLFKVKSSATSQQQQQAYANLLSAQNSAQSAVQSKQSLQAQLETARKAILDAQTAVDQMNNNLSSGAVNPDTKAAYTQNEIDSINSALTIAKENFTATETKYNQADGAIAAANASQAVASTDYQATQDTIVTAPVSGTVANFAATIGTAVSASSGSSSSSSTSSSSSSGSSSGGSPVLVIGNFSNLSIKAAVNEVDIPQIRAGQKATISLDAFSDKTFVGVVNSVDAIGTSNSGVVTYNVYINFIAPPADIKPGMTASAIIQLARHLDVLTVPSSAVQSLNGDTTVRVMKNGKVQSVPVETGLTSDTDTEIVSGLSEGDTVVTSVIQPTTSRAAQASSPFSALGGRGGGFGGGTAVFRTGGGGGARGGAGARSFGG